MKYKLLVIDHKDNVELYGFGENKELAGAAYRNHCYMSNDKYVVLLECDGEQMKPLATYYYHPHRNRDDRSER